MKAMKKTFSLALIVLFCLGLTGCGSKMIKVQNPDGTVTKIEYESAVPFERAPYFELSGSTLSMTFNGMVWYEASIIDASIKDWVMEGEFICESSNIRVYQASPHAEYDYAYVLTLTGTEDSYILFYSDENPSEGSYGNDFTTSIRYFVDKTETVPDLKFD